MNAPFVSAPEDVSSLEGSQRGTIAYLASPAAHSGVVPDHVVTHISHIFVADDTALKLKRARKVPFVDYSTVALREAFCRREVAVNRRFAPQLYRGVQAVTHDGERYALEGPGEVVDWVVEMNRFPAGAQLVPVDKGFDRYGYSKTPRQRVL